MLGLFEEQKATREDGMSKEGTGQQGGVFGEPDQVHPCGHSKDLGLYPERRIAIKRF